MDKPPKSTQDGHAEPVSARIRARVVKSGKRYFANDNISAFIEPGELEALLDEVAGKMQGVLESLVIDTVGDHNSRGTAQRVARMYLDEVFSGRYVPMPRVTEFPNAEKLDELMIIGPVTVRSACSHHLVPILGRLWVGVLPKPGSKLIGLSKYARIAEWVMSRPQIQEEAVMQLADLLEARLQPAGLALVGVGMPGVWGAIAMPAQALSAAEARKIAAWLAQGAKK